MFMAYYRLNSRLFLVSSLRSFQEETLSSRKSTDAFSEQRVVIELNWIPVHASYVFMAAHFVTQKYLLSSGCIVKQHSLGGLPTPI